MKNCWSCFAISLLEKVIACCLARGLKFIFEMSFRKALGENLTCASRSSLQEYFAGADDDQFEEEKELIMKEIERVSGLPNHDC